MSTVPLLSIFVKKSLFSGKTLLTNFTISLEDLLDSLKKISSELKLELVNYLHNSNNFGCEPLKPYIDCFGSPTIVTLEESAISRIELRIIFIICH